MTPHCNDNTPRTPFEAMIDECYDRLSAAMDIEREAGAIRGTFQTFIGVIAAGEVDTPAKPEQLCLLADFETLLQPFDHDEETQLRLGAAHLLSGIVAEEGLETATQCALQQFAACSQCLSIFAAEGLIDPALPVNHGLIEALERAWRDPRHEAQAIRNSAWMLADYLTVADEPAMPPQHWQRLADLADAGIDFGRPGTPSRADLRAASVVRLATARQILSRGPHG